MDKTVNVRDIVDAAIAVFVLGMCVGGEVYVMVNGLPKSVDPVITGRVLGTLDAIALTVVGWYFGNSRSSREQVDAITSIGQAAANTPIHISMPDGTQVAQTTPAAEVAKSAPVEGLPEFKSLK